MAEFNLKEYKTSLRRKYKKIREEMPTEEKLRRDGDIFKRVISSKQYLERDTLLTYVSADVEADTRKIIEKGIADGKRVFVPRCVSGTRLMDFYRINSMDDLEKGTFGVLEPKPEKCEKSNDFRGVLCIVPGLSFDMNGYRLGYGGGYYDRFLCSHGGMLLMGLCYCVCTTGRLPRGYYDKPVDILVTEKYIKRITEVNALGRK